MKFLTKHLLRILKFNWYKAKQYEFSIQCFSNCISHEYQMRYSYCFRSLSYRALKQFSPEAIDDITQAVNLSSNYETDNFTSLIYTTRGMIYRAMGEYEKAITDFSYSLEINPSSAAYTRRADAKRLLGLYKLAILYFDEAIKIDPNNSFALSRRGLTKKIVLDYNGAIKDYNSSIYIEPTNAYTHLDRGRLKVELFGKDTGVSDFEKVLQLDQTVLQNGNARQFALFSLGKNEESLLWMNKIIEKYPTSDNYYDFARLYSLMNEKDKSVKYLGNAFDNGFDSYVFMANDDNLNNIKFTNKFNNLLTEYHINVNIPVPISDIDVNIPETHLQNKNRFALIIGNEDYSSFQLGLKNEINVKFARNDAFAFKMYCINTLGIPERNITLLKFRT